MALTRDPNGRSEGRRAGGRRPALTRAPGRRDASACAPSCPDGRVCGHLAPRSHRWGRPRHEEPTESERQLGTLRSPRLCGPGPAPSGRPCGPSAAGSCVCVLPCPVRGMLVRAGGREPAPGPHPWVAPRAEPAAPASTLTPTLTALQATGGRSSEAVCGRRRRARPRPRSHQDGIPAPRSPWKAGRLLCVQFAADLEGRLCVPREGRVWLTCRGVTVGGR